MSDLVKYLTLWFVVMVLVIGSIIIAFEERCSTMVTVTRSDGRETVEITTYGPGCGD